jgi:hypothetical protein
MVSLFDNIPRDFIGPAQYSEPNYSFLNRSARMTVQRIRETLETWFSHYPKEHQPEFQVRYKSKINYENQAAFFELFLHELLLRLGCSVQLHPKIPIYTKTPDFLVSAPDNSKFFLEAALVTGEPRNKASAKAIEQSFYDALNQIDSPNFFIGVTIRGEPHTQPPVKHIKAFLEQELAQLDPDNTDTTTLHWPFDFEGWHLDFSPIPKKPEARKKPSGRPIGFHQSEMVFVNSHEAIKKVLKDKAGRYGNLGLPYLIAVNVTDPYADYEEIILALYGSIRWMDTTDQNLEDASNGLWRNPKKPRWKRLSGVLASIRLTPWNLFRSQLRLYHNHSPEFPYESVLKRLQQVQVKTDRLCWINGESLANLLALPEEWPE